MNGIIINKTKSGFFTEMAEVFDILPKSELQKMWLISDYVCPVYPIEEIPLDTAYVWLTGDRLKELLLLEDPQFIWGVFSSFNKKTTLEEVLKYPVPKSEFNTAIWDPELPALHPLSGTEIISWDAGHLIIKSADNKLLSRFKHTYLEHQDFKEYILSD